MRRAGSAAGIFGGLRAFLSGIAAADAQAPADDDPRIAAAALLFHVMDADGIRDEAEQRRLREMLGQAYGLDADELDALLAAGEQAEEESVDLHGFTSVLMRHWDERQRAEFVGHLWDLVFADGELHELEDHTLWRVCDLLGIDARERVEARRRVAAARARSRDG